MIRLLPALLVVLAPLSATAASWPDLSSARASGGGGENDAAVVVAIEKYAEVPAIAGAAQNGDDWYRFLTKSRGVPVTSVSLLRDREGTVEKIRKAASAAASQVKPGGTLWFVFIGHGAPAQDGSDGVLVGYDAQQEADSLYARSLPQKELLALLDRGSKGRALVILDACFSGRTGSGAPIVKGLQPLIAVKALAPVKALLLTAGRADQFAGPLPGADRPAFSYLMLGALRGWGDKDGDGVVTAGEALAYTREVLATAAKDRTQTPELAGDEKTPLVKGAREKAPDLSEIVLARVEVAPPKKVEPGSEEKIGVTAYLLCQRKLPTGKYQDVPSCAEAKLSAGDRVKIGLETDRTARIYVFNFNSTGQFQTLFPDPNIDNEVAAKQKVFLPAGEDWLEIDDVKGVTENIRVIASPRKIAELESLRGLDVPPAAGGGAAPEAVKSRGAIDGVTARGFNKPGSGKAVTLTVGSQTVNTIPLVASGPGVALLEFSIQHR